MGTAAAVLTSLGAAGVELPESSWSNDEDARVPFVPVAREFLSPATSRTGCAGGAADCRSWRTEALRGLWTPPWLRRVEKVASAVRENRAPKSIAPGRGNSSPIK